jgi:hypothetical protein
VKFAAVKSWGHMVEVRPTSGEAADARFLFRQEKWNGAYERAGRAPASGKVYRGRRNFWYADLD